MIPTLEEKRRLRVVVWDRDKGHCRYCNKNVSWSPKSDTEFDGDFGILEHVIPRSRGGTWNIDNLILSCNYCNFKKCFNACEKMHWERFGDIEAMMRIAGIRL